MILNAEQIVSGLGDEFHVDPYSEACLRPEASAAHSPITADERAMEERMAQVTGA